jgi:hypothetical protein
MDGDEDCAGCAGRAPGTSEELREELLLVLLFLVGVWRPVGADGVLVATIGLLLLLLQRPLGVLPAGPWGRRRRLGLLVSCCCGLLWAVVGCRVRVG